jgi:hypothetical protein
MRVQENDGTLSRLRSAQFLPSMGVVLCVRESGRVILAHPEEVLLDEGESIPSLPPSPQS